MSRCPSVCKNVFLVSTPRGIISDLLSTKRPVLKREGRCYFRGLCHCLQVALHPYRRSQGCLSPLLVVEGSGVNGLGVGSVEAKGDPREDAVLDAVA